LFSIYFLSLESKITCPALPAVVLHPEGHRLTAAAAASHRQVQGVVRRLVVGEAGKVEGQAPRLVVGDPLVVVVRL
jgi:hypothetical protein